MPGAVPAEGIEHHRRHSRREPIPAAAGLTQGWSGRQDLNGGSLGSHEWQKQAHTSFAGPVRLL